MSDTTFIPGTVIASTWLNDVNDTAYSALGTGGVAPTTPAAVRTNLGFPASTGSSLVGHIATGTGAVATTAQTKLREVISVKDFGATGNGTTDDTTAIQAAVDAVGAAGGGTVVFPAGSYKVSATITNTSNNFVNYQGAGRNATRVFGSVSTLASIFKIGGGSSGPFRCSISAMSLDTAKIGVDISSGSTNTDLDDLVISTNEFGVKNTGDYTTNPIKANQGTRLNRLEISGFSNSGIYNYCASELYWDEIVVNGGSVSGTTGIFLDSASNAVYAHRANLLACQYGLQINDSTGITPNPTSVITTPSQMWFSSILGDTSITAGIQVSDGFELNFVDCWGSGSTAGNGIVLENTVKEVSLVACRALGNANHGLLIGGVNSASRIKINGGMYANNGYATNNTYDGINIVAGMGNLTITGAQCYNDTGIGLGSTQRYGIRLETGATDNFSIIGNVCNNNLSGGISDASTGTAKQIFGNIPVEDNSYVRMAGTGLKSFYSATTTYDPPSLPTGTVAVTSLTVTGVVVGDVVSGVSHTSITASGWILSGSVTAADTVAVTILNMTGGTVDLGSGTLRVNVMRAV